MLVYILVCMYACHACMEHLTVPAGTERFKKSPSPWPTLSCAHQSGHFHIIDFISPFWNWSHLIVSWAPWKHAQLTLEHIFLVPCITLLPPQHPITFNFLFLTLLIIDIFIMKTSLRGFWNISISIRGFWNISISAIQCGACPHRDFLHETVFCSYGSLKRLLFNQHHQITNFNLYL